jgi:hypothetical protein
VQQGQLSSLSGHRVGNFGVEDRIGGRNGPNLGPRPFITGSFDRLKTQEFSQNNVNRIDVDKGEEGSRSHND